MVCWGNEGAVFELWLCWWGCPPTRTIKRSPAPGREGSACAPAPGPSLCRRGGSRACRVPSSATSCERRAWLPGGSCRTRGGGCRALGCPSGTASTNSRGWIQRHTQAGQAGQTPPLSRLRQRTKPCIISSIIAETRAARTDLSKMMYTPETRAASQPLLSLSDLVLGAVGFKGVAWFWTVNSALLVKGEPKCLH